MSAGVPPDARPKSITFLKRRADFLALRNGDRAGVASFLLVRRRRSDADPATRVGLTVTKKLGGAVIRNRIRRRLREAARAIVPQHGEKGCDYLLIARGPALTRSYPDLLDDIERALLSLARKST